MRARHRLDARAQGPVGGDPADGDQGRAVGAAVAEPRDRVRRAVGHHIGHRRLEAGAEIGDIGLAERARRQGLDRMAHGGLEAGEGEIAALPAAQRAGQGETAGIAVLGGALDRGPAGIAEPQHLAHLVEGLADRVVDRGAEQAVAAHPFDGDELAMPARDQQSQIGEVDRIGQPGGEHMGFEMVDREEREVVRGGDRLAGHRADDDAADQPRPGGRRHPVERIEADPGILHGPRDHPVDRLQMRARGDLRHHPAIVAMGVELVAHHIGEDRAPVVDHRRRGLVAARLDPEDQAHPASRNPVSLLALVDIDSPMIPFPEVCGLR